MSSFPYIAILGRQPELALIELESLLGADKVRPFGRTAALLSDNPGIDQLGGTIKIGHVIGEAGQIAWPQLPVDLDVLPRRASKTPFAVSVYGFNITAGVARATGLALKRRLAEGGSVRLVAAGRGTAASAAELHHNKVTEDGFELLVVGDRDSVIIALTVGVQDVDWYSKRDYGRPKRSARVGMLPPKLAQILVNTTTPGKSVYDPFCGPGGVLQEALLLGRVAGGSDIAPEMVDACMANLTWLDGTVKRPLPSWQVRLADACELTPKPGQAIVSEGYLGPPLSRTPDPITLHEVQEKVSSIYEQALRRWAFSLAGGDEVSLCVPVWRQGSTWAGLTMVDDVARLGYTVRRFTHVRQPVIYARDDQAVGRQLLLLRKN